MKAILNHTPASAGCYKHIVEVDVEKNFTVKIPVHVVRGRHKRPVLLLAAGEHGVEVNGMAAVDSLVKSLTPESLYGTLVAIPVVSPPNVKYRSHRLGQNYGVKDGSGSNWDTYKKWPGSKDGDPSERITSVLTEAVVRDAEYVINLHSWEWNTASCSFTSLKNAKARKLVQAFSTTFVRDIGEKSMQNTILRYALDNDKPAFMAELSGQHWVDRAAIERAVAGMRNVMIDIGMLQEKPTKPGNQYIALEDEIIKTDFPGIFIPLKSLEDIVRKNDVLGYILNVDNGERKDLFSPVDGVLWSIGRRGAAADVCLRDMHAFAEPGEVVAIVKQVSYNKRK